MIAKFSGVLNIVLLGSTYLMVLGVDLPFYVTITFGVSLAFFVMVMGYFYLKFDLQKSEYSSNVKEMPEMLQLFNDVKEIKEMLWQKHGKV